MRATLQDLTGKCDKCSTPSTPLYYRQLGRICENCCDLEDSGATSKVTGRIAASYAQGRLNPRSQPRPFTMWGLRGTCIWCQASASPKFHWYGGQDFTACGWGCAGQWMDREINRVVNETVTPEDEAYIKESFGLETS